MAAALQLAFRVKPGEFYHKQCAAEEERNTFIHCEVSPEMFFSRMAKPLATTFPELFPFLWQT